MRLVSQVNIKRATFNNVKRKKMALKCSGYLDILLRILIGFAAVGETADLCPYDRNDENVERNTKFRFCNNGCCGSSGYDVCCHDVRTEIIIGCVVGGIIVLTVVIVAACCYYTRVSRPRPSGRRGTATIIIPSTVLQTYGQNQGSNSGLENSSTHIQTRQLPPAYDDVIEDSPRHDKPPSYDDVVRENRTIIGLPKDSQTFYG